LSESNKTSQSDQQADPRRRKKRKSHGTEPRGPITPFRTMRCQRGVPLLSEVWVVETGWRGTEGSKENGHANENVSEI